LASQLRLQLTQPFAPAGEGRGNCRVQRRRGRPLAPAVAEDVDLREPDLPADAAGLLEVLVRLAGEADDDVRCERRGVDRLTNPSAAVEEARAAIAPAH